MASVKNNVIVIWAELVIVVQDGFILALVSVLVVIYDVTKKKSVLLFFSK